MTTDNLILSVKAKAPLAHAYYAFSNKSGWFDWFSRKGSGHVDKGAVLHLVDELNSFALYFNQLEAEQMVAFTLIDLKTMSINKARVTLQMVGDQVEATVEFQGVSAEQKEKLQTVWQKKLLNLKSVLETGKDLELWNRPFLGVMVRDWVTPQIAKEKGLSVEFGLWISGVFPDMGSAQAGLADGDIITSLDGVKLHGFEDLAELVHKKKAGDQVSIEYFRGSERHVTPLQLGTFPVPETPATAHDLAEQVKSFYVKGNAKLDTLLSGLTEVQAEYRPAAGEWSVKNVLAHLVAAEVDWLFWISSMVAGREDLVWTSNHQTRLRGIQALYPSIQELRGQLDIAQKEMIAFLNELPAEFVTRTGSLARLSSTLLLDLGLHYKDHLGQLQETAEKAANVREDD